MNRPEGAGKGTRLRAATAWCEYRGRSGSQAEGAHVPSLPAHCSFVSAGRGCFSPGFPQHALSCTNTAGGSAGEKRASQKTKGLRNPAVGRPSAICFSASLISFTEHPLGNTGLVYGFTEAESWAGSIVSVLFSFLLHSVPFSAMNFIKVDSEPQA